MPRSSFAIYANSLPKKPKRGGEPAILKEARIAAAAVKGRNLRKLERDFRSLFWVTTSIFPTI